MVDNIGTKVYYYPPANATTTATAVSLDSMTSPSEAVVTVQAKAKRL